MKLVGTALIFGGAIATGWLIGAWAGVMVVVSLSFIVSGIILLNS
jgi:hypothetical protein